MKSRRKKRVEVEVEAKLKKDEGEKRVKVKRAADPPQGRTANKRARLHTAHLHTPPSKYLGKMR